MLIYDVIQDVLTTYLENLKRVLNSVVILVTFSLRIVCKTQFAKRQLVFFESACSSVTFDWFVTFLEQSGSADVTNRTVMRPSDISKTNSVFRLSVTKTPGNLLSESSLASF